MAKYIFVTGGVFSSLGNHFAKYEILEQVPVEIPHA